MRCSGRAILPVCVSILLAGCGEPDYAKNYYPQAQNTPFVELTPFGSAVAVPTQAIAVGPTQTRAAELAQIATLTAPTPIPTVTPPPAARRFTTADILRAFDQAGLQPYSVRAVPADEHFGPATVETTDVSDGTAFPAPTVRIYLCSTQAEMIEVQRRLNQFQLLYFVNGNAIIEVTRRSPNAPRFQAAFTALR